MNLYLTADVRGQWTGGSQVVSNEAAALSELGPCEVWDRDVLQGGSDPWGWDEIALQKIHRENKHFDLCQVYAGCFTKTVHSLQFRGCKVVYTVAAHDVARSRQAHLDLGLDFPYEHLTNPEQFQRYIGGYLNADVVVCPSTVAAETVRRQGRKGRIEVIPHGIDLPDKPLQPLPTAFVCGYLGSFGADKGVKTLLEAWKRLNYADAVLLLGGKDSTSRWVQHLCQTHGGGNIELAGWQDNPWDFMDRLSCYVQPSATEGFGIEVLEAMARGRPVVCSDQAGAQDLVNQEGCGLPFKAGSVAALCRSIQYFKEYGRPALEHNGIRGSEVAKEFTWTKVRQQYQKLWREVAG